MRWNLVGSGGLFLVLAGSGCTGSEKPAEDWGIGGSGGAGNGGGMLPVGGKEGSPPFGVHPSSGACAGTDGETSMLVLGGSSVTFDSVVVRATVPPPPLSGGTLHAMASGQTVVVSDPDRDHVYIVDLPTAKVRADVALQPADEPGRIAEDGMGRAHVVLRRGGAVVTLDPVTGTIVERRAVCATPRGITYEATGDRIHVACAGGELVSLPAAGGAAVRTVMLERDLRDVVVSGTDLLVSKFRAAEVLTIGPDGAITGRTKPGTRERVSRNATGSGRQTMSPSVAWRMQAVTGGGALIIHQRGVDGEVGVSAGGYAGGRGCGGVVETVVSKIMPGQPAVHASPGIGRSVLPIDIAIAPDGVNVAFVSAGNASTPTIPQLMVSSVDTVTRPSEPGNDCTFPIDPIGMGSGPDSPQGQTVAVAYTPDGTLVVQSREPAGLWLPGTNQVIPLSQESHTDTGHTIFHANAGGGIACASCHPEGGEDGRVWTFACIGDRRTQSIRGGIGGTEPFHWDGDMKTFGHLVQDVFVGRMSGPMLATDQTNALMGWIDTIPTLPVKTPADGVAVERGRTLFNDPKVACGTCHQGAKLTNNAAADVGTGKMFQVPSLVGISWRAPFLHNGCAPSLTDRFGACGGGDKHGQTSQLSSAQLADLVSYLETL